ncbi:MAG: glycerophosphodiester phosphodiesterase family protein [Clostridia bacterium]|nr:glycerophosphodiester phosphodiesterase family protein [Clostridia bacterium]
MSIQNAAAQKVLIAAHRGVAGGNVPCNSYPAFEAALRQGADIIELDISMSRDGVLYVFHPGMEPVFLRSERLISDMDAREVDQLPLRNQDSTPTQYYVPRFEDIMHRLRGRCYINLDKFWTCPERITESVRSLGMQDQVLIKTSATPENFARVEAVAPDLPYMVIARDRDDFTDELLKRPMRYVGVEALFEREDAPIASEDYLSGLRKKNLLAWGNAIVYDYRAVLTAGHTDDISISEDPEKGWGWLVKRGFNIIQTDWTLDLARYLGR